MLQGWYRNSWKTRNKLLRRWTTVSSTVLTLWMISTMISKYQGMDRICSTQRTSVGLMTIVTIHKINTRPFSNDAVAVKNMVTSEWRNEKENAFQSWVTDAKANAVRLLLLDYSNLRAAFPTASSRRQIYTHAYIYRKHHKNVYPESDTRLDTNTFAQHWRGTNNCRPFRVSSSHSLSY